MELLSHLSIWVNCGDSADSYPTSSTIENAWAVLLMSYWEDTFVLHTGIRQRCEQDRTKHYKWRNVKSFGKSLKRQNRVSSYNETGQKKAKKNIKTNLLDQFVCYMFILHRISCKTQRHTIRLFFPTLLELLLLRYSLVAEWLRS